MGGNACLRTPLPHVLDRTGGGAVPVTRASSSPAAVLLDVFGRRVRVEAGGHRPPPRSRPSGRGAAPSDPGRAGDETVITLPRSDRPLAAEAGLRLADQIRELALAAAADRLLVLRAAAVATPTVRCSPWSPDDPALRADAAAELSRRGFGYVTDELLATDESFDVVAFPEPLRFEPDEPEHSRPSPDPTPSACAPAPQPRCTSPPSCCSSTTPATAGTPELTRVRRPDDVRRLERRSGLGARSLGGHRPARPGRRGRRAVGR